MRYFLVLFLVLPLMGFAENPIKDTIANDKLTVKKDTAYIIKQISDDKALIHYQEILEKTNEQLSLWWNPYGVLISCLGVLFTILTIIAAVVVYRQSKEYRELIKESLTKHENVLSQLITENNQQLKNIESNLNNLITEYREKLITATEKNKEEINDLISKLEEQRESVELQMKAKYVTPDYDDNSMMTASLLYRTGKKHHKCTQCGFGFFVNEIPMSVHSRVLYTSNKTVTCPSCGNVDSYI